MVVESGHGLEAGDRGRRNKQHPIPNLVVGEQGLAAYGLGIIAIAEAPSPDEICCTSLTCSRAHC